jgi:hypothetical protein
MTVKELAERINGTDYADGIDSDLVKWAEEQGLVICYGASDDLVEFEGAICDETGAWGGEDVYLNKEGSILEGGETLNKIQAEWSPPIPKDASWLISTNIPNAEPFDMMEGENVFCRGIVFSIYDLK